MAIPHFAFHFPQSWDARDLANAVPLRLSELPPFDAAADGPGHACANGVPPAHRLCRQGYIHNDRLAPFRIG